MAAPGSTPGGCIKTENSMKKEIIEKMQEIISSAERLGKKDFEIDKETLRDTDSPFLWFVRKNGTWLVRLGIEYFYQEYDEERNRFALFRKDTFNDVNTYAYIWRFNGVRCFYWDGYDFREIPVSEAQSVYDNIVGQVRLFLANKYPEEAKWCNTPLRIDFESRKTEEEYNKSVAYAQRVGDSSLEGCVKRLSEHIRWAVDHFVLIKKGALEHEYLFHEVVNGKVLFDGGIIMNPDVTENRWNIYT